MGYLQQFRTGAAMLAGRPKNDGMDGTQDRTGGVWWMAGRGERIIPPPAAPPVLVGELFGISEELVGRPTHLHGAPLVQPQVLSGVHLHHGEHFVKGCVE